MRGPDVSFVRQERLPSVTARRGFHEGAPDLAVEIVSPGDRPAQVAAAVRDYLAAGTPLVWVVDPRVRSITVHQSAKRTRLRDGDRLDGAEILPGLEIDVREIFGPQGE